MSQKWVYVCVLKPTSDKEWIACAGDERNKAQLSLLNWVVVTVARVLLVKRTINVPVTLLVWSETYPE